MAICLLASILCVAAVPASAAGYSVVDLYAFGNDGRVWILGFYNNFEAAWNEAVYYSTHLDEAWNASERYESEDDRVGEDGFAYIIVDITADWNADSNGSFGTGVGFKDGAIYVPNGAKLEVSLNGNTINSGEANRKAMQIDAGADFSMYRGTVIGNIYVDNNAKTFINNINVVGNTIKSSNSSARTASVLGEGSLTMIIALLALVSSVAAIGISISHCKKNVVSEAADNAEDEE